MSRGVMSSPASRARLTSWIELMLSPPSSKKFSSIPTRGRPRVSAKSAQRISSWAVRGARQLRLGRAEVWRRQRLAIQLAVGGQRQSIEQDDCRRHHVVGQTLAKMAPQERQDQRSGR